MKITFKHMTDVFWHVRKLCLCFHRFVVDGAGLHFLFCAIGFFCNVTKPKLKKI